MRGRTWCAVGAAALLAASACGNGNGNGGGGGGTGGGKITVTLVQGIAGEEFYETMACGAKAKASQLGVELTVQGPQKFDPTLQTPLVNAALAKNSDLAGVFAANLNSATGAGSALQASGKKGAVKMIGFDAGPAQVKQLQDGVVQALIAQDPATIGADGVEQAVAAVKGQSVQSMIGTRSKIVTKDNLNDPDVQKVLYKPSCR